MYEILAVLGGIALIYSAVAGGVERTWISGPVAFVALGVLRGPVGVGPVVLVEPKSVSAMLVYSDKTKVGVVLEKVE
jgi:hypothetical protein